jgi:sialidase-1
VKIPSIFTTMAGTVLVFGEARMINCYDWAWTDLVYRRSEDNGNTWSDLQLLYANTSDANHPVGDDMCPRVRNPLRVRSPPCEAFS